MSADSESSSTGVGVSRPPAHRVGRRLHRVAVGVGIVIGMASATALAAGAISTIVGIDGVVHGCYSQRNGALRVVADGASCGRGEQSIEWNQQGPPGLPGQTGETGPQGVPGEDGQDGQDGSSLASIDGLECETGSIARPDARIDMAVDPVTGAIALTCRSVNPILTIGTGMVVVPSGCIPGTTGCSFVGYEVDIESGGVPITTGLECQSFYIFSACTTQQFTSGTIVELTATSDIAGYEPTWSGCDSVVDRTCTVQSTEDRTISVSPQAS